MSSASRLVVILAVYLMLVVVGAGEATSSAAKQFQTAKTALFGLNSKQFQASADELSQLYDTLHPCPNDTVPLERIDTLASLMMHKEKRLQEHWDQSGIQNALDEAIAEHMIVYLEEMADDISSLEASLNKTERSTRDLANRIECNMPQSHEAAAKAPLPSPSVDIPFYVLLAEWATRKLFRMLVIVLVPIVLLIGTAVTASMMRLFTSVGNTYVLVGCMVMVVAVLVMFSRELDSDDPILIPPPSLPGDHTKLVPQIQTSKRAHALLRHAFDALSAYRSQLRITSDALHDANQTLYMSQELASVLIQSISEISADLQQSLHANLTLRLENISTHISTAPRATESVDAIHRASDRLEEHRLALAKNAHQNAQLRTLVDQIASLDTFLMRAEVDVYSYLLEGIEVNRFFDSELDMVLKGVMDGDFLRSGFVLTTFEQEQRKQLDRLNGSCIFLTRASEAVRKVRAEAVDTEGPVELQEREARAKKIYARAASIATGLALAGTSAVAAPTIVVALPVAAISLALSGLGYAQIGGMYALEERQAADALRDLREFGNMLLDLDLGLKRHHMTLSMLVEDVSMFASRIAKATERARRFGVRPELSAHDKRLVAEGVEHVRKTAGVVLRNYQVAVNSVFRRLTAPSSIASDDTTIKELAAQ